MSCGSCGCNPCHCDECDPNNEPLASALNNFIATVIGTLERTCVNNEVKWTFPCNLEAGVTNFERRQGESLLCYILRLFEYLNGVVVGPSCAPFYNKIMLNGQCYDTWQAAYDANSGVTTPNIMLVGQGTTFGDLTLSAPYNSNIVIEGFGDNVSQVGNINGSGFAVNLKSNNVIFGSITSAAALITLSGRNSSFGALTGSSALITNLNSRFTGQINNLNSLSVIRDGIFTTSSGNLDCIANLSADGAQFQNCLFVPNGTGFSITASVARTIIAYALLHKNGLGPNVTLSEGSETVSPNFLAP